MTDRREQGFVIPAAARLDRLADRGWPAVESVDLNGWTLRFSSGVTNRANSVLASCPVADIPSAVDAVEREYREHGLPAVFQLSEAAPAELAVEVAGRGYVEHSRTLIFVAAVDRVAARPDPGVVIADAPDPAWLDLWWSVDGRGGDEQKAVARRILTGGRALYGSVADDRGRLLAVARLALVADWGGIFAVATRADARRRGHARTLIRSLAAAATAYGVHGLWLQVLAGNEGPLRLYRELGFEPASSYSYWSAKPEPR